mmetsp:Transcript_56485/g.145439  ORF Transcript_56485/g.145439 Transcript_56485/m.145439 type:complete len:223 (-) Transcript_56485:905-1573(-)
MPAGHAQINWQTISWHDGSRESSRLRGSLFRGSAQRRSTDLKRLVTLPATACVSIAGTSPDASGRLGRLPAWAICNCWDCERPRGGAITIPPWVGVYRAESGNDAPALILVLPFGASVLAVGVLPRRAGAAIVVLVVSAHGAATPEPSEAAAAGEEVLPPALPLDAVPRLALGLGPLHDLTNDAARVVALASLADRRLRVAATHPRPRLRVARLHDAPGDLL